MKIKIKMLYRMTACLALCGFISVGVQAAESMTTGNGTSKDDPKVVVTVSEEALNNGTTQTTRTTKTEWSNRNDSGIGTSYESADTTVTLEDGDKNILSRSNVEEGTEITTQEKFPILSVLLTEDNRSTNAVSELQEILTGTPKTENTPDYDFIKTIVEHQRKLEVILGETILATGDGVTQTNETRLAPIQSVWSGEEKDISKPRPDRFGTDDSIGPGGYDFRYTGWGQDSYYGTYYTTISTELNDAGETIENTATHEGDILHFLLTDMKNPDAPDHTVYCVDVCTSAKEGWWYKIDNLETAGYYPDKTAEDHIRAIVNHGYWGTANGETGSLTKMIAELEKARIDGNKHLEGLDFTQMTEGEAQAATQMAIWQYGNRYGKDTELVLEASNYNGDEGWSWDEEDELAWERINAAAAYLADLTEGSDNTTVVLTQDKFIEKASLTVKDKIDDGDQDKTNDRYDAELSFTLFVTPSQQDRMAVRILQNGEVIAEEEILPGQKEYTVKGITLKENEEVDFGFEAKGVQYLEQGAYLYTSEVRDNISSQTFVGIAEGYRAVDVQMNKKLNLSVDDAIVTTEHFWGNEGNENYTPATGDTFVIWYVILAAASLFGMSSLLILKKKID